MSRGLLDSCPCLLIVHGDTAALAVHAADLKLAQSVTRLGSDLKRRHRPRVVDRHAFAPVVDVTDGTSCPDVALEGGAARLSTWSARAPYGTKISRSRR